MVSHYFPCVFVRRRVRRVRRVRPDRLRISSSFVACGAQRTIVRLRSSASSFLDLLVSEAANHVEEARSGAPSHTHCLCSLSIMSWKRRWFIAVSKTSGAGPKTMRRGRDRPSPVPGLGTGMDAEPCGIDSRTESAVGIEAPRSTDGQWIARNVPRRSNPRSWACPYRQGRRLRTYMGTNLLLANSDLFDRSPAWFFSRCAAGRRAAPSPPWPSGPAPP